MAISLKQLFSDLKNEENEIALLKRLKKDMRVI